MISYTAQVKCKSWLEWDLNAIQARMCRTCFDSITEPSSEKHEEKISNMISYTVQVKCKSWLEWDLNAIQARMCSVSILLQNHPQRNMKRKFLTWFLTLPKSSVNVDSSETWTLSKRGCIHVQCFDSKTCRRCMISEIPKVWVQVSVECVK